jgi:ActR/RegA family two-component response regulator
MRTNILITDDQENWRETLSAVLRSEDYKPNIVTAASFQEAQLKLKEMLFSVATLDMRLEDWDKENAQGIQLLEYIKRRRDGTQVVMLTGYSTEELRMHAEIDLEAYFFVEKQKFDNDRFRELIRKAIEECDSSPERISLLRDTGRGPVEEETVNRAMKGLMIDGKPFEGNKPAKRDFANQIRTLAAMMVDDLRPLVSEPKGPEFVEVGRGNNQMVGRYWSRVKGKAFAIVMRDSKIVEEPQIEGTLIKSDDLGRLKGFLYEINAQSEEFLQEG